MAQIEAFQAEALNVACALGNAVKLHRACTYENPGEGLVSESEVTFLRVPANAGNHTPCRLVSH